MKRQENVICISDGRHDFYFFQKGKMMTTIEIIEFLSKKHKKDYIIVWLYVDDLEDAEKEAGGLVKVTLSFPLFENLEVFISPSIKSRGWVAGNIYLEKATEFRFGVNLIF